MLGARRVSGRQIDFIDDRQNLQTVLDGEIGVGECLCLNALRGIDDEYSAFTCSE